MAYYGALGLMGILCFGALLPIACHKVYITDDEVNQRIMSELPPGSTLSQVNDFLKKQNWEGGTPLREFHNYGTWDNMLTEEEKRKIKWISWGAITKAEKSLFGGRSISICFYYDKEEKLVTYKIHSYSI
jgi:hypothetical protein